MSVKMQQWKHCSLKISNGHSTFIEQKTLLDLLLGNITNDKAGIQAGMYVYVYLYVKIYSIVHLIVQKDLCIFTLVNLKFNKKSPL